MIINLRVCSSGTNVTPVAFQIPFEIDSCLWE